MDIFNNLLGDSSVWIKKLVYELTEYRLRIILVDDPISMNETREIVVSDISNFNEAIEEFDVDLVDSLIGIHWLEDAATLCIKTETREIFVKTATQPYAGKTT